MVEHCTRLIGKWNVDDNEQLKGWMSKTKEHEWRDVDGWEVEWLLSIKKKRVIKGNDICIEIKRLIVYI